MVIKSDDDDVLRALESTANAERERDRRFVKEWAAQRAGHEQKLPLNYDPNHYDDYGPATPPSDPAPKAEEPPQAPPLSFRQRLSRLLHPKLDALSPDNPPRQR